MAKPDIDVTLSLTVDQALVLLEWLTREDARGALPTEHHAELNVLWEMEAQLEKQLVQPLWPDYMALLSAARERLVRGGEKSKDET